MKSHMPMLLALLALAFFACQDSEKEQAELNRQLEEIENVEQAVDSTLNQVDEKAEEVELLIAELDSI